MTKLLIAILNPISLMTAYAAVVLVQNVRALLRLRRRCTEPAEAEIADYKWVRPFRKVYGEHDMWSTAVYRYSYDGKTYETDHGKDLPGSGYRYQPGDRVVIRIDPNNPKFIYDVKRDTEIAVEAIIVNSGVLAVLIPLLIMFCSVLC